MSREPPVESINEELAKIHAERHVKCENCGREYPDTIINFEGRIHHNCGYKCLDTQACRRFKRKQRRKR